MRQRGTEKKGPSAQLLTLMWLSTDMREANRHASFYNKLDAPNEFSNNNYYLFSSLHIGICPILHKLRSKNSKNIYNKAEFFVNLRVDCPRDKKQGILKKYPFCTTWLIWAFWKTLFEDQSLILCLCQQSLNNIFNK